jgi:hypothetical protein
VPPVMGELHEVPTCTNGVTTWALSQPGTRRNCITSKDARYPWKDGKTPWTFTTAWYWNAADVA